MPTGNSSKGALFLLTVLVAGPAGAEPQQNMFAAFDKYCIQTRAVPEAVKAAVEADGGVAHALPDYEGVSTTLWLLPGEGSDGHRPFGVAGGHAGAPHALTVCQIDSDYDMIESLDAFTTWVAVSVRPSRDAPSPGETSQQYVFAWNGDQRTPIAEEQADRQGDYWVLTINMQQGHGSYTQLMHILPVTTPP
jgi:hypothetical protein